MLWLLEWLQRILRRSFSEVSRQIESRKRAVEVAPHSEDEDLHRFFRSLDLSDAGDRAYVDQHLHRFVTTIHLTPPAKTSGRALELGTYMHMPPALKELRGYQEVRGAYFGQAGRSVQKTARIAGREVITCEIDLFDAERDVFPYPDRHFELVLACEVIEHLRRDPMHMLFEIHRILEGGGILLLTTPNCASLTSLNCVLAGTSNPYIYSCYPDPSKGETEPGAGHIREYTPVEMKHILECAGFTIDVLKTESLPGAHRSELVIDILRNYGFATSLRGEQMYCVARKVDTADRTRYPEFLYDRPQD